jgi:membrane protease YdiL (CAAX protease family)
MVFRFPLFVLAALVGSVASVRLASLMHSAIVLVALAGSLAAWTIAFGRLARHQPLLARPARRPVPWGLVDLLLATMLLVTFQLVNALVLIRFCGIDATRGWENMSSRQLTLLLLADPLANLAALATAWAAIRLRTRAEAADFGLSLRNVGRDVGLGTTAFVMLAPLVYGLQQILVIWFPYEHPLISALKTHPELTVHGAVVFAAVIGAPLVEEFFYRVLWQGGLQAFIPRRDNFWQFVFGDTASPVAADGHGVANEGNGDRPIADVATPAAQTSAAAEVFAIVVSSALFALMHLSQGAAPIPLFVLALGLGYLYARTGRVLPCIVVHIWLNAFSLFTLWIGTVAGRG